MKLRHIGLLIILFCFSFCSKKSGDDTTNSGSWTEADEAIYKNAIILQDDAAAKFDEWKLTMDSIAALEKVVEYFQSDPSVTAAELGSQGIAVQYSNGIRGGIFINPEDLPEGGKSDHFQGISADKLPGTKSLVGKKKILFLGVHYWQRRENTEMIWAMHEENASKIGYTAENHTNFGVTLGVLRNLSGYGVIHVYSHGWAWPHKKNIYEVYLMTGDTITLAKSREYAEDLKSGRLIIPKFSHYFVDGDHTLYWVSKDFIVNHNDFSKDTVLFYGGFCYSFLGSWPYMTSAFAQGAYFGHTWRVLTNWNRSWAMSYFNFACDDSWSSPGNPEEWITSPDPPKSYYDEADKVTTKIQYAGDATLSLWKNNPDGCSGLTSITDSRDGKTYPIVQIGEQCWLKKNMNYQTDSSWCYENDPDNCNEYGRLYNWDNALVACPNGWHLPSKTEWDKLISFNGGVLNAGGRMKEAGTTHWESPNDADNSSGFTALGGGERVIFPFNHFVMLKTAGSFWSSTPSGSTAWYLSLVNSMAACGMYSDEDLKTGMSVRCIKDSK